MKMKTINLDSFCTKLSKDVEAKRSTCYNISEYGLKNIFTVNEKFRNEIYLEIPEYNKYDVLFNKIAETFSGQYELVSVLTLAGEYEINIVIDNIIIVFDYYTNTGKNWLYKRYSEI